MAFTGTYVQPQEVELFNFYATGGANGAASESLSIAKRAVITEVRLTWSVAFASVEDFVIKLSAGNGSAYNHTFVSQALNGVQYLNYIPNCSVYLESTDQLKFTMSMASGANTWGLQVIGWAIEE